jgi:pyridoxal 5'-phosphate synthase pdxS subunit
VRHARAILGEIRMLSVMPPEELMTYAKKIGAPFELIQKVAKEGKLPVVNFAAGGLATPADAALLMQIGVDGVFVGSGIFKSGDPLKRAKAIVKATTFFNNPEVLAEVSRNLGEPMVGRTVRSLAPGEALATRGW